MLQEEPTTELDDDEDDAPVFNLLPFVFSCLVA
jgi:hypothetical protein